jgi:uncharacterized protein involved in response to NO
MLTAFLAALAALWAFMLWRGFSRGQFIQRGIWGWHRRQDHPKMFLFYMACMIVEFGLICAVAGWTLKGS